MTFLKCTQLIKTWYEKLYAISTVKTSPIVTRKN